MSQRDSLIVHGGGRLGPSMVMVDWVSGTVATPPNLWPGYETGHLLHIDSDGSLLARKTRVKDVEDEDPSSSRRFRVWTPTPGSLYLSGNPVKLLQGHNLWGSANALGLFFEAGVWVRQMVGLFPGPSTWEACEFTGPMFSRLDITRSYRFPTDAEAHAYVRHVVGNARTRHGQARLYDDGTAYFGLGSRRWSMKVYVKRPELLRWRPRPTSDLVDWSEGVVRFELTLRAMEIRRILEANPDIDFSDPDTLQRIWQDYFDRIEFNANQTMSRTPSLLESDLPARLKVALRLWRTGDDLRTFYPRPTFYRYRRAILDAVGVDIAVPPPRGEASAAASLDPAGWDPAPLEPPVEPREQLLLDYRPR